MNKITSSSIVALVAFCASAASCRPAAAQEHWRFGAPPPYDRLNLSNIQWQQIRSLDAEWRNHYMDLQPRVVQMKQHLQNLLATPNSDPLEIATTQQRLSALHEQLGLYATSTYIRKRRVLNPSQQLQLQSWMRQMISVRQHP